MLASKLTLIGSKPVVFGRTGNYGHFVGTIFEVWVRVRLVPRNTLAKTGCGTNYK